MPTSIRMLDRAQAPTLAQAQAALDEVGGSAWAYYLGGAGHFKDRTSYTPRLVGRFRRAGIHTLPIYAGAQSRFSRARGLSDAKDAVARARKFGDEAAPVMCDIERGPHDRNPAAALAYARGFCEGVHDAGLRAGVYGPFELMIALAEPADGMPDVVWPARWISDPGVLPPQTRWPADPRKVKGIPANKLAGNGRRAWQFVGDVVLPRARINVDISVIDMACFASGNAAPAPKPAPKPAAAAKPAPKPKPAPSAGSITVKPGDTLFGLERAHRLPRGSLLRHNQAVLDDAARQHGHADSRNGSLIFPGTTLRLP